MQKTILILILIFSFQNKALAQHFSFHLGHEPHSLKRSELQSTDGHSYLYNNIFRGLYIYDNKKKLIPLGAKSCRVREFEVDCILNKDFKWSDGSNVVAEDYVRNFREILSPNSKTIALRLFSSIQNAKQVFNSKKPPESLGVIAASPQHLIFKLEIPDPDFLYKLTQFWAAPLHSSQIPEIEQAQNLVVTGPYKIEKWNSKKSIQLKANTNYSGPHAKDLPDVDIFFVEDDQTALNLFESKKINFLRRVPTSLIPNLSTLKEFKRIDILRFDFIGFNQALQKQDLLRSQIASALDYHELQKIYSSPGLPGCVSLDQTYIRNSICVQKQKISKMIDPLPENLHFGFPLQGGEDMLRGAEWIQSQLKKNLNLKIDLQRLDSKILSQNIQEQKLEMFRKSIPLDRPTCLAAIEIFHSQAPDNNMKFQSKELDKIIEKMRITTNHKAIKKLCTKAIEKLVHENRIIPLGKIQFSLMSRDYKNWTLNELDQLDLSQLEPLTK